jgi:hypothetical protein
VTDLNQPATAAEFQAAGVDAATAANLAMQHNMMTGRAGTLDQRAEVMTAVRERAPLPKPTAPAPATTPEKALEALSAHQDSEQAQHLAAHFAPPAQASDYRLWEGATDPTPEEHAQIVELQGALHGAGMSKMVAESIAQSVTENSRSLASETDEQAHARLESQTGRLKVMWGKDYDANVAKVKAFEQRLRRESPVLGKWLDAIDPFLSPLDVDTMLQAATHGARRR